ncbi:2-phospho-L-lactate guanylyltransferase [soil metagenome]|jgi:2-phospho-L-lactate guanylyltransferase
MTTVAVVPIKKLEDAKTRLAERLTPPERRCLVLNLLRHVLTTLQESSLVHETIVVTPDPGVLREAELLGADRFLQTGVGLNAAVRLGREHALRREATTMLVLLPDLPLLTVTDIDALVGAAGEGMLVLAPDRHGSGTNAIVLHPPDAIDPAFGINSLYAHRASAQEKGFLLREYHSIGTGFDLDTEADLEELEHLPRNEIGCLEG